MARFLREQVDSEYKEDPFGDLNFQLPFQLPTLNGIEENLYKFSMQVIQNIQNKVATDTENDIENKSRVENHRQEPEYLKDDTLNGDQNDSLLVVKKSVKNKKKGKKNPKSKSSSSKDAISATSSNTLSSETSSISSLTIDKSEQNNGQVPKIPISSQTPVNEHDKLAMILAAFPSENEIEMSTDVRNPDTQIVTAVDQTFKVTFQSKVIPEIVTEDDDVAVTISKEPEQSKDFVREELYENRLEEEEEALKYQLIIPPNPYKFTSNVNKSYIKWNLIYSPNNTSAELISFKSTLINASGHSDETNECAFLLYGSSDHHNKSLFAFPGFKKIKLPKSDLKICTFSASPTKIILLDEDGNLFIANDWTHPRFLLGIKWNKINTSRTGSRLIDASCNVIDQITWFIDEDGCSWLYRLKSSTWLLARDDHVPSLMLQMITVSPQNSAIVWAVDRENQLYARQGVFNDKSDADCLITGIDWVDVEPVVGNIKFISASLDCIWVVSCVGGEDRLFKRIGIDPPSNYVGTEWEEVLLPLLIEDQVMRISSSLSGDLYLLTSNGLLYHYCIHETIPLKAVDDGWLLL